MDDPHDTSTTRSSRREAATQRRIKTALAVLVVLAIIGAVTVAIAQYGLLGTRASESGPQTVATPTLEATAPAEATASAEPTEPPEPRVIEIGWVGDLTPGSKYGQPPGDGRALFETTREYLQRPHLMIANLEGTFGDGGPSKCDDSDSGDCYAFQAPPENADALAWAGIDAVNLANNHSNDYFSAGVDATKAALEENDIAYTGLGDSYEIFDADGVSVALIGFSPYSWSPDIGDLSTAEALVEQASDEASVVVVLMHAGAEGSDKTHTPEGAEEAYGEFRGDSRAFSYAVIDAGADLVLGSGPHVVRGMEVYDGKLIAYSLGNFAGWKNFNRSGNLALSGLLTVRVDENGTVIDGRWISLRIAEPGVPRVDWNHEAAQLVDELSAADFKNPVDLDEEGSFTISPGDAVQP